MLGDEVITPDGLGLLVARWWGPPLTDHTELHVVFPDGSKGVFYEDLEARMLRDVKPGPYR